jgi:hypothetical protein
MKLVEPLTGDTYRNMTMSVDVRCNKCMTVQTRVLKYLIMFPRCGTCETRISSGCVEISKYMNDELGRAAVVSDWSIIPPYEVDVVDRDVKLAIEYHGLYWHSDLKSSDPERTARKRRMLSDLGYTTLTVFADEWRDRRDVVTSALRHRLGMIDRKLYGRKCAVVSLTSQQHRQFFDENHIVGDVKAMCAFGLMHGGELVAAMSLRRPLSKRYAQMLEVARFASKRDTIVVGGLSKLTSRALSHAASCGKLGLISYVDMRFSTGVGYEAAGYRFVKETAARFWWTDMIRRYDRFSIRASGDMSEREVAKAKGMQRVWGDTNRLYVMHVPDMYMGRPVDVHVSVDCDVRDDVVHDANDERAFGPGGRPRRRPPKLCPACNVEFWGQTSYCSKTCWRSTKGIKRTCAHCGKVDKIPPSYAGVRKFCSDECYNAARRQKKKHIECRQCGAQFVNGTSPVARYSKYCSIACSDAAGISKASRTLKLRSCARCNAQFSTRKSTKKYCTSACYHASRVMVLPSSPQTSPDASSGPAHGLPAPDVT